MPGSPIPRRKMEAKTEAALRIFAAGLAGCIKEPADLATQQSLEQQTAHLLGRRGLPGSETCRREVPRCSLGGVSKRGIKDVYVRGEGERGTRPPLAEAGMNLESIRAIGCNSEVKVFVDQGYSPSGHCSAGWPSLSTDTEGTGLLRRTASQDRTQKLPRYWEMTLCWSSSANTYAWGCSRSAPPARCSPCAGR